MFAEYAYCPTCGEESPVESIESADDLASERICLTCDGALFVDPILPARPAQPYTRAA